MSEPHTLIPPDAGELRDDVRRRAENRPGVYRMTGPEDRVIYVGKSIRVRSRLLSYFRADREEKAAKIIRNTRRIAWEYIPNEFASLVREMRLIQEWQPRFNVQHRSRRKYAFVKITREMAPRLILVTEPKEDGATYYGPFPRVASAGETLREISHVLGLRDCPGTTPMHFSDQCDMFGAERTPLCLRGDLGSCLAPCSGSCTSAEYLSAMDLARRFLEGDIREPVQRIQQLMYGAAERKDYEYAAMLRDRWVRLQGFRDQLIAFQGRVQRLNFLYRVPGFESDDRTYVIQQGRVKVDMATPRTKRARRRAARTVEKIYAERPVGPAELQANEAAEILLVARWFRLRPEELERTIAPAEWLASLREA